MSKFSVPNFIKDDGHAHIKFSQQRHSRIKDSSSNSPNTQRALNGVLSKDPRPLLKKYGYCVIEGVFSDNFSKSTVDNMWKWLENLGTGINRKKQSTWSNKNWPLSERQGMIRHTVGHEDFVWKVREHKNVVAIFTKIFNTKKLLASFDGVMIGRPIETGFVTSPNTSWLHTDQNIIKNMSLNEVYSSDKYSIQGIANFEDVDDHDASLFIGEKTHTLHTALFKYNKHSPKGNWYNLDESDVKFLNKKGVKWIKVNAPKGSLILFDSRCFHQGFPHKYPKGKKKRKVERFRYVVYVTLAPAHRASTANKKKKIKAVKDGRMTSHWAANYIKLVSKPHLWGKDSSNYPYLDRKKNVPNYKKWSVKRKKLAGLIEY